MRCARPVPRLQVVSAKLALEPAETFVERVNAHLPAQIRVLGATRVTEGFAARQFCDRRRCAWGFRGAGAESAPLLVAGAAATRSADHPRRLTRLPVPAM